MDRRAPRPVVVVENRPARRHAGREAVVKAPPDGYTLFFAAASNTVGASLFQNLSYDFVRDTNAGRADQPINLSSKSIPRSRSIMSPR